MQASSQNTHTLFGLDELETCVKRIGLQKDQFCLTGSSVLAALGLRENRDIDLIVLRALRRRFKPRGKAISLSDNVEMTSGNAFAPFGLKDDVIIRDPRYHITVHGYRFVGPELILAWKLHRGLAKPHHLQKDLSDIKLLSDYAHDSDDWDWTLVPGYKHARRAMKRS